MRKAGLLLCISMLGVSGSLGQDFYDINSINTIEITFEESNWDYLLDNLVSAGNEARLLGSVTINGVLFDSVGVRYKGNSTYNANRIKNPLNIKLDYIIEDQEIQNYGTLKLANAFKDPSFVREALSYEIARKYFPASQSNFAKVYINGTYLGLYANDQDVDRFFMSSHFGSAGNVRIKGELGENLPPSSMGGVWEYLGSDSSSYFSKYALESDTGWGELVEFLDTLNHNNQVVDQVLNIDRHLWFLAFQNLLVNLDGPINNPQNYYLYQDDLRRFNPIPWDLNESFGVFTQLQSQGNLGAYQLQRLNPFVNLTNTQYPIISKILSNARYRRMYVAHMRTMLAENFGNGWYYDRALAIQGIIGAEVQADPNKFYTYSNFISNLTSSVGSAGPPPNAAIIGLTELMETRISYISNLADFSALPPEILSVTDAVETTPSGSAIRVSAGVDNATSVLLAYRLSTLAAFEFVDMFDDGLHNDGPAGDGTYGSEALTANSTMQYYLYAENDASGVFLPEHAASEYFSVNLESVLVINEFLADNASVIADQDGEFDDWIELYNNSDAVIQLGGYFLSDDGTDLMQWVFPDTMIQAHDFITIWADNDEEQNGLHANFKLSASGETLYLLSAEAALLDEITFFPQVADSSLGRSPDGSGAFIRMAPTFNAPNQVISVVDPRDNVQPLGFTLSQNFPNPFNGSTTIRFYLPSAAPAALVIYNLQGGEICSMATNAGRLGWQEILWNGTDVSGAAVSTGLYLARLQAGDRSATIKLLLIK